MKDKSRYYIGYEYQVIIPLMYIRENSNVDIVEITQFQMLDYRIKAAQEFAYNNINVLYETGNNGLIKFKKDFSDYVLVLENGDELSYRLSDDFTSQMFEHMLSKLDDDIRSVLTDKEVIKSSIYEKSLS